MQLLSPKAVNLIVKADDIADNVLRMFFQLHAHVRQLLKNYAKTLNCTCDVWTFPNNDPKTDLTGHWIIKKSGKLQVRLYCFEVKANVLKIEVCRVWY